MPADDEHETDEHEALGPPPGAPGRGVLAGGYWARQARQLPVINAIQQLIEDEPDRFTGLTTNGSSHITLHLVDRAVLTEQRMVALLEQARAADIEVIVSDAARSRSELSGIRDEIVTARPWGDLTVRGFGIWIDPAAATVAIEVASKNLAPVRMALRRYGDAVVVTSSGPPITRLPRSTSSRTGWSVASLDPDDAVGRAVEEVVALYRGEGFQVETYYADDPMGFDGDLRPHRIRLLVLEGRVLDATQG